MNRGCHWHRRGAERTGNPSLIISGGLGTRASCPTAPTANAKVYHPARLNQARWSASSRERAPTSRSSAASTSRNSGLCCRRPVVDLEHVADPLDLLGDLRASAFRCLLRSSSRINPCARFQVTGCALSQGYKRRLDQCDCRRRSSSASAAHSQFYTAVNLRPMRRLSIVQHPVPTGTEKEAIHAPRRHLCRSHRRCRRSPP